VACAGAGGVVFRLLGERGNLVSAFEGIALASPCVLIFLFARRAFYLELRPAQALIGSLVYSALLGFGQGNDLGQRHSAGIPPIALAGETSHRARLQYICDALTVNLLGVLRCAGASGADNAQLPVAVSRCDILP